MEELAGLHLYFLGLLETVLIQYTFFLPLFFCLSLSLFIISVVFQGEQHNIRNKTNEWLN